MSYDVRRGSRTGFSHKAGAFAYILIGLIVGAYLGLQLVAHYILWIVGIK